MDQVEAKRDRSLSNLRPFDGPTLSVLLTGKEVAECYRSNELLVIRMTNGDEIRVAWVDGATGTPVKGEPAIAFFGRHVRAKTTSLSGKTHPVGGAPVVLTGYSPNLGGWR